jgi:PH (Pleckstrin Homology) domain-containing protein
METRTAFEFGPKPSRLLAWAMVCIAIAVFDLFFPIVAMQPHYLMRAALIGGAVVLIIWAGRTRPRFRADADGVVIRSLGGRRYSVRLAWSEVERIEFKKGGDPPKRTRLLILHVAQPAPQRRAELRAFYEFDLSVAGISDDDARDRLRQLNVFG